jgi:hypothetical protein
MISWINTAIGSPIFTKTSYLYYAVRMTQFSKFLVATETGLGNLLFLTDARRDRHYGVMGSIPVREVKVRTFILEQVVRLQ